MKVLFDALGVDSRHSGTRTRLLGLLPELARAGGLELGVLHGPGISAAERATVPTVRWLESACVPRGPLRRLLARKAIYRDIASAWDLVVAECVPFPVGVPLLPCIHDLRHLRGGGVRGALYRKSLKAGLDRAEVVHVVSAAVQQELARFHRGSADRARVVPNGVSSGLLAQAPEDADLEILERRGIRRPYMLIVGHLEPRKDPRTAVEVRVRLAQRGLDLPALFIGQGPFLPEETLCWLEAAYPQQTAGWCLRDVDRAELAALYRQARVLLAPSCLEGFGLAPLEAAASGVPVIASDIPAHREVLGAEALYCPRGDVEAWVSAVLKVLYHMVDVPALVERARERACTFTWERAARSFLDALPEAASR